MNSSLWRCENEKNLKFKFKRLEKDLTQAELREKSKTSIQTIVDIERGKSIDGLRVGTLKKLAAALDTTVQELFFSEEE
ncbi:helix-turn-helix transcriptional regulator [Clostridium perfringens]|nr:helix-turn-helix transcriptional regulator [Clostridium perfringens]